MRVLIVAGTRPEIIKLCPVVKEMQRRKWMVMFAYTMQHFSEDMSIAIFDELGYEVDSKKCLDRRMVLYDFEKIAGFAEESDVVIIQGDTTSGVLGALAAVHTKTPLVHVEAGLRSFDESMREERNRKMIDHAADVLMCPTRMNIQNCLDEGIPFNKMCVTGNTIVDVIRAGSPRRERSGVMTLHRPELVRNKPMFARTLKAVNDFAESERMNVHFPIHPLTKDMLTLSDLQIPPHIVAMAPVGPKRMWKMIEQSSYVFTDSGGLQEEACVLGTRTFTIRPNTERQETLALKCNVLISPMQPSRYMASAMKHAKFADAWEQPYGKNVSVKIVNEIEHRWGDGGCQKE